MPAPHGERLRIRGMRDEAGSGVLPLTQGEPFLTSIWAKLELPVFGEVEVGSPLLFDLGVYLVVMGVTLSFVLSLAEE